MRQFAGGVTVPRGAARYGTDGKALEGPGLRPGEGKPGPRGRRVPARRGICRNSGIPPVSGRAGRPECGGRQPARCARRCSPPAALAPGRLSPAARAHRACAKISRRFFRPPALLAGGPSQRVIPARAHRAISCWTYPPRPGHGNVRSGPMPRCRVVPRPQEQSHPRLPQGDRGCRTTSRPGALARPAAVITPRCGAGRRAQDGRPRAEGPAGAQEPDGPGHRRRRHDDGTA